MFFAFQQSDVNVPVNLSMAAPTELRLDDTYVVLYVNLARLLVQGVIPFIGLSFLNYRIYWVIRRRSQLVNRPQIQQQANGVSAQQKKANEAQQAQCSYPLDEKLGFFLFLHFFMPKNYKNLPFFTKMSYFF